ncbi:DUF1295 domain-containing protein [Aeromicrobium choanae]|uniref:Steroid 5-alpha reductase family enzyme n=1 Tax=Aeromicrobium choanae TaxID=1736691 RepID=A0A1T4Z6J2_9ACTN|nr:DUF1295 domain-containing protein [Aeromicrobium choanae]SKB09488.1 Steroid 5-alpha reductase family enzyme [Aeromicrobium choanae]
MVTVVVAFAAVVLVMAAGAVASRVRDTFAIVDVAWPVAFGVGMAAAASVGLVGDLGEAWRTVLALVLVLVWAGRLASHLGRRTFAAEEDDPRYLEYMGGSAREVAFVALLTKVYGLQAVLVLAVGYPVFASASLSVRWPVVAIVGAVVAVAGVAFEAVADRQLAAYRATPKERRAAVLSTGVWSWSRHPNYFGEAMTWWGLWLVAGAASGWAPLLWTLPAPIVLTAIVTVVSGVRIAERRMRGRSGWDAYAARTSVFVPLPPRQS